MARSHVRRRAALGGAQRRRAGAAERGRRTASSGVQRRRGAPTRAAPRLLDRQGALHAALAVTGHGTEEGVLPGLEGDLEPRDAAVLDDRALLVDAVALERDVVIDARVVLRLDGQAACGRLGGAELVGEGAARVGRDVERAALRLRDGVR